MSLACWLVDEGVMVASVIIRMKIARPHGETPLNPGLVCRNSEKRKDLSWGANLSHESILLLYCRGP